MLRKWNVSQIEAAICKLWLAARVGHGILIAFSTGTSIQEVNRGLGMVHDRMFKKILLDTEFGLVFRCIGVLQNSAPQTNGRIIP
jgi:hypothetical protein